MLFRGCASVDVVARRRNSCQNTQLKSRSSDVVPSPAITFSSPDVQRAQPLPTSCPQCRATEKNYRRGGDGEHLFYPSFLHSRRRPGALRLDRGGVRIVTDATQHLWYLLSNDEPWIRPESNANHHRLSSKSLISPLRRLSLNSTRLILRCTSFNVLVSDSILPKAG